MFVLRLVSLSLGKFLFLSSSWLGNSGSCCNALDRLLLHLHHSCRELRMWCWVWTRGEALCLPLGAPKAPSTPPPLVSESPRNRFLLFGVLPAQSETFLLLPASQAFHWVLSGSKWFKRKLNLQLFFSIKKNRFYGLAFVIPGSQGDKGMFCICSSSSSRPGAK